MAVPVSQWPAEVAPTLNAHFGSKQGLKDQHALGGAGHFVPVVAKCITRGESSRYDFETTTMLASITNGPPSRHDGGEDGTRRIQPVAFDARQSAVLIYGDRTGPLDTDGHSVGVCVTGDRTHALTAQSGASEDGTGRGTPLVPVSFDTTQVTSKANRSNPRSGDPCHPLAAGAHPPAVAMVVPIDLRNAHPDPDKHDAVNRQGTGAGKDGDPAHTVTARLNGIATAMQVRRLTPVECERLQGFPDGYTDIRPRGKDTPDGARYKALGNSMAVPVMRWIGERIARVEEITKG